MCLDSNLCAFYSNQIYGMCDMHRSWLGTETKRLSVGLYDDCAAIHHQIRSQVKGIWIFEGSLMEIVTGMHSRKTVIKMHKMLFEVNAMNVYMFLV